MRGNTLSLVLVLAGGLAGGIAASGCGENPVPTFPSYARDIQPMMTAHCIRCHGAGGTLNTDPLIPPDYNPTSGPPLNIQTMIGPKGKPNNGTDLTTYAGVAKYADSGGMPNPIMSAFLPFMPPPPSDALGGWELDTFQAWLSDPRP